MQYDSYDVAIVGGGNVGLTLALTLAQKTSLSIVILESQSQPTFWQAGDYHHRVSAIALSSKRLFQSLDVWPAIKARRISPFENIQIWDAQGAELQFSAHDVAEPFLGYIIENDVIQTALLEKLALYAQVTYVTDVELVSYSADESIRSATLTTKDKVYRSKLVVGADGARSWLRDQAGIQITSKDYDQVAIVASVTTTNPHSLIARQLFLETGPIGLLPLTDLHQSSIVWSLPSKLATEYLEMDDAAFIHALNAACQHQIGSMTAVSKRYPFSLHRQQANQYIGSRLALIGDAAHTIHPLAGQGVNMGLLDAASLAEIVMNAHQAGRDIGGISTLRRYERWRKGDNALMMQGVDMIMQAFAVNHSSLQSIRAITIDSLNQISMIKNIFTRYAVGSRVLFSMIPAQR